MLFVYYGTNTIAVRAAAYEAAAAAGESPSVIDAERYEPGLVREAASGASLFGASAVFVLDTPAVDADFATEVADNLSLIAASPHTFIVIEGKLLAAEKKPYQKYAAVMEERAGERAERFNTFAFADALARKDRKALWLLYQDARRADIAAEEIAGVLWWQLKTLRLAAATNSAAEAGIKDYPYRKAKGALKNFTASELEQLSMGLLTTQHESRRGVYDLDLALEHWLLTLTPYNPATG
jgi:DNA polymerase III delta subunit